jgi:hypothetical protein
MFVIYAIAYTFTVDIFTYWNNSPFLLNVKNVSKNRDKQNVTVLIEGNGRKMQLYRIVTVYFWHTCEY